MEVVSFVGCWSGCFEFSSGRHYTAAVGSCSPSSREASLEPLVDRLSMRSRCASVAVEAPSSSSLAILMSKCCVVANDDVGGRRRSAVGSSYVEMCYESTE